MKLDNCKPLLDLCKDADQFGLAYFWINDKPYKIQRLYIYQKEKK